MSEKKRSEDQTAISVSIAKDLLTDIDAFLLPMNMNRSQYFRVLAIAHLVNRTPLHITEYHPTGSQARLDAQRRATMQQEVTNSNDAQRIIAGAGASKPKPRGHRKNGAASRS